MSSQVATAISHGLWSRFKSGPCNFVWCCTDRVSTSYYVNHETKAWTQNVHGFDHVQAIPQTSVNMSMKLRYKRTLLRAPASRPLSRAGRQARPVPPQPDQVTLLGFPDLAGYVFKTRRPSHYLRGRRRRRCVCITGWAGNNRGQAARCAAFVRDFRLSSLCVCLPLTVSSVASPSRDLISLSYLNRCKHVSRSVLSRISRCSDVSEI